MIKKSIIMLAVLATVSGLALYVRATEVKDALHDAVEMAEHGKTAEAVNAIQQIITQNPQSKEAHVSLGLVYFWDKQYGNALAEFNKTLSIQKDNPMALYFVGMIYEALGQKQQALAAWQNYLAVSENSTAAMSEAHRHIGISKQESIERAKKHIKVLKGELEHEAH